MRGLVKRFDVERGIGIITVSGSGEKLPVISNDILSTGPLAENDRVSFGVRQSRGHKFAANVSLDEAAPAKNLSMKAPGLQ
jgi:cold shock CspA family protein